MEQTAKGNEGNGIALTQEIVQTKELDSITSTKTKTVDTDVEIVSEPADLEEGIELPESYQCEKRKNKPKHKEKCINYVKFVQIYGFHIGRWNTLGCGLGSKHIKCD